MNITFMVGNGFDLNLGLKTSYKDFYAYYKNKSDGNDMIFKEINDNYDLWSNLELGLGNFLGNVKESELEDFFDSKENLESNLIDYLEMESSRLHITDEDKFVEEFTNKIINFSDRFTTAEKMI